MKAHVYPLQTFITDHDAPAMLQIVWHHPSEPLFEPPFIMNDDMPNAESSHYLPRNWWFTPSSLFPYRPVMRPPNQRTRHDKLDESAIT